MYNRYYNRQTYNRALAAPNEPVIMHATETLLGYIHAGGDIGITERLNEHLSSRLLMATAAPLVSHYTEALTGLAHGFAGVQVVFHPAEDLGGTARADANIFLREPMAENLRGVAHLGADIYLTAQYAEVLAGRVLVGADIYIARGLYETLNGYVRGGNVNENILYILADLPPGGELIVDSDNYNVLLNGQNAIEAHAGNWIWLGRPTVSLTLSSIGADDFEWEVFYVARYL